MADVPFSYERAKIAWSDNLRLVMQDMQSRLMPLITPSDAEGEDMFSEWLGDDEMNEGYVEGSDIVHATPDWRRRWIRTKFFDKAYLFADHERMRVLTNPMNKYRKNIQGGAARAMDNVIFQAISGDARTGKDGETTVPFPASQVVPHGGTGLTLDKLKQGVRKFKDNRADNDDTGLGLNLHCIFRPIDEDELMKDDQVTSMDYVTQKVIVDGGMDNATVMSCDYTRYPDIPVTGSGPYVHRVYLVREDAVEYGWKKRLTGDVSQRKDLQGQPWQTYGQMDVGAARMQEKGVVAIECQYATAA